MQEIQGHIIGDVTVTQKNGHTLLTFDLEYDAGCYFHESGTTGYFIYKCCMWAEKETAYFLTNGRKINVKGILFIKPVPGQHPALKLFFWANRVEWFFDSETTDKRFWSSGAAESEIDDYPF